MNQIPTTYCFGDAANSAGQPPSTAEKLSELTRMTALVDSLQSTETSAAWRDYLAMMAASALLPVLNALRTSDDAQEVIHGR